MFSSTLISSLGAFLNFCVAYDAASLNTNFGTPQVVRSPAGRCALRDASLTANAPVR